VLIAYFGRGTCPYLDSLFLTYIILSLLLTCLICCGCCCLVCIFGIVIAVFGNNILQNPTVARLHRMSSGEQGQNPAQPYNPLNNA